MKTVSLALHDRVSATILAAATNTDEIAGVLLAGVVETPDQLRLLGREFVPAPPESYLEQSAFDLRLSNAAFMGALSRAAAIDATAIFVHSHPNSATDPVMSSDDDEVDEQLRSVFQIRTGSAFYGSLVVQLDADTVRFSGRVWRDEVPVGPIVMLRQLGRRFRFDSAFDAPKPLPSSEVFDRQVRAFGPALQHLLGQLHICVVGAGGTGSPVIEQLIRLGVGRLTVVDPQDLTASNVTRVFGSGLSDEGRPKVDIACDNAARIGLGTSVTTIRGSVTEKNVALELASCDLIFGCTDDHAGRLVLARIAYWLLIPVLDVGVRIYAEGEQISTIVCRLNVQVAGAACIQCWGTVDAERARAELMSQGDLEAAQRDGYAPDLNTTDPAVVSYTLLVASLAVSEMIGRMSGVVDDAADRVMFLAGNRQLSSSSGEPVEGHWCGREEVWGTGVTKRFLDQAWPK